MKYKVIVQWKVEVNTEVEAASAEQAKEIVLWSRETFQGLPQEPVYGSVVARVEEV